MARAQRALVVCAALVGLGLSGCGSGASASVTSATSATSATSSTTSPAPTHAVGEVVSATNLAAHLFETMTAAGGAAVMITTGTQAPVRAELIFFGNAVATMKLQDPIGGGRPILVVGSTIYLPKAGTTDEWQSASAASTDQGEVALVSSIMALANFANLHLFLRALEDQSDVTVSAVQGDQVTYHVVPKPSAAGAAGVDAAIDVTVVDDRPVTATVRMATQTFTLAYSDWGAIMPVDPPQADKVTPYTTG